MKKILILLVLLIPFVFLDVNAAEMSVEDKTKSQQLLDYAEENNYLTDYIVLYKDITENTYHLFVGDHEFYVKQYSNRIIVNYDTTLGILYKRSITLLADGTYSVGQKMSSANTDTIQYISDSDLSFLYVSSDVVDTDSNVVFTKNYPLENQEPGVTPTPSPDADIQEECDSPFCDISDEILGDIPEEFNFVDTIFTFLLILVFVFTIISPIILVIKLISR